VRALRVVLTVLVLAGAVWVLRGIHPDALAATLHQVSWPLVALAAATNLTLNTIARTQRWRSLLPASPPSGEKVSFVAMGGLVLITQLGNNVLPLRLGEALRTLALHERFGYPLRTVVASIAVEKVIEVASLSTWAMPAIVWARASAELVALSIALLVAATVALVVLVRLARRPRAERTPAGSRVLRVVHEVQDAARVVDAPRTWWKSLAAALASDGIDVVLIGLCCVAVGVHVSPAAWCAILVSVNLVISIPSTPAQLGMLEAGVLVVLLQLGVPREQALAAALLYHAVHAVPTSVVGGVAMLAIPRRRRAEA
jgi:uncharacterized protein (TIRG00374 family)